MKQIPLMFFSDAPSASSGLARITRDLAVRVAQNLSDVFRVCTVGYGAGGSKSLPFFQYSWTFNEEFIIYDLPELWEDFAEGEPGIFFSIQDPSRMIWFSRPEACSDQNVANWLRQPQFEKWGYFPVDASGPHGKLSVMLRECLIGYNRILSYTKWAEKIMWNTVGDGAAKDRDLTNLPHGIDTKIFCPKDRELARKVFPLVTVNRDDLHIDDDAVLVGIVATNQSRKDYAQAIQVFAELNRKRKAKLWIHTDAMDRYWSIPYLLTDYGINGAFVTTQNFDDETMANLYSACDVTLGIGLGEGMGYPIFESLACGTPCVHGNYGGAPENMPKELLVPVHAYRQEGIYACQRPVFQTSEWLHKVQTAIGKERKVPKSIQKLDWNNLWPAWEKWFRDGAIKFTEKRCADQSVAFRGEQDLSEAISPENSSSETTELSSLTTSVADL